MEPLTAARGGTCLAWTLLAGWAIASGLESAEHEPALPTPLVETARTELAQVDITVTGPPEVVAHLGPEDFKIRVNFQRITDFRLDRDCPAVDGTGAEVERPPPLPHRPVSYLFYFDQPHLTLAGRQRGLDLSRQLVVRLIQGGSRGMIVSNAGRLAVIEELTDDPAVLLVALERLEHDRAQWDALATEEESRIARVVDVLNREQDTSRAISMARSYQREERWRTESALRRLSLTLMRLSEAPQPKAVLYFADTMRSNAGEHYLSFFGQLVREDSAALTHMLADGMTAPLAYDRVVNQAAAQGIRFYTIEAEGLIAPVDQTLLGGAALTLTGAVPQSSRIRFRDARNTLVNLAGETGGQAFLNGLGAGKIARRILGDFACMYVASFDPAGLPEDAPLRVTVKLLRDDAHIHARGRIVFPSEATRRAGRLLGAFALERTDDQPGVRCLLVPTGFRDGTYSALLQVSVPGTAVPGTIWDIGASVVRADRVREEASGRLSVSRPGVPLVLEREIRLEPGRYEIVAVAHETASDLILRQRVEIVWPVPPDRGPSFSPIALLQPAAGAFLRGGDTRTSGSLARGENDPVSIELPTALVALVCRGSRHKGPLRVERSLVGSRDVEFPGLEFKLENERCAQVRDLLPGDSLAPGTYRYEVRVLQDGEPIGTGAREFLALASDSLVDS